MKTATIVPLRHSLKDPAVALIQLEWLDGLGSPNNSSAQALYYVLVCRQTDRSYYNFASACLLLT